ncbi:MAG TPA: hypothetical protein VFW07_23180 [Parafilimonas sp.]|nr:hypothetical protein [Parafilimonas sp.]
MRIVLVLVILITTAASKAQIPMLGLNDYAQRQAFSRNSHVYDSAVNKKWFVTTYAGVSTSFNFFHGGNATVVSAPLNLQLNRRLNNNLYAFAGVSAAPAYVNFNQTFLTTDINKGISGKNSFNSNSFGMYSRAEVGLMYVNDERTFSISGSIGIERNNYPVYPYNQINRTQPAPVAYPKK